jgi:hypothetical protein
MFPENSHFFGKCCSCIGFKRVIVSNIQRLWFEGKKFLSSSSCANTVILAQIFYYTREFINIGSSNVYMVTAFYCAFNFGQVSGNLWDTIFEYVEK